jgi:putative ABC transport system permease protein
MNIKQPLESLHQDFRYAIRMLAKKPLFTATVIFTLAIGIGANTAIFTIVNAVLLRPLPYKDADRLAVIWGEIKQQPGSKVFASYADFQELQRNSQSFEDVAANTWASAGQTLMWRGEPYRVLAIPTSQNLFSLLGEQPLHGRTFNAEDLSNGCTVVLSHRFWQNRLGATQEIVNGTLAIDGQNCVVVGIMRPDFEFFPRATEIWTLITPNSNIAKDSNSSVAIFGRLKPGVSIIAAHAEAVNLHEGIVRQAPADSWIRETQIRVYELQSEFTFLAGPNLRLALLTLFAAVGMVLLIACVNIAGLLLSQGAERQKELAVRAALGCGRHQIIRQLLVESVTLAMAGAAIAVGIAVFCIRNFRVLNPIELPPGNSVTINWHVLLFTAVVGVATGLCCGLIPALKTSRVDLNEILKGTRSGIASDWLGSKSGRLLIVAEVGLCMVLLTGAGLLIQSIERLTAIPLSFRIDHLLTGDINLPPGDYTETAERSRFYSSVLTALADLPGVEGAALSSNAPLRGLNSGVVTIAGKPAPTTATGDVGAEQVSDNFLRLLGLSLLRGREFDSRDRGNAEQVAIINQKFAEEYFPNVNPVGKQMKLGLPARPNPWSTIVGVVANAERGDFFMEMGYRIAPIVYRPITQRSGPSMSLLIRARGDPKGLIAAIQSAVKMLDARVPVDNFNTVEDLLSRNFAQPRFRTLLLGVFAAIALLLAAVGIHGVLMQAVLQRTREIGVRMALGAERYHVMRMVIRQGMVLTIVGLVCGLVSSFYLTRFLRTMLFDVGPTDPQTLGAASVVLMAVTLAATYIPARRATKVDPIVALKQE